jgi:hypothetical protein
MEEQGTAGKTCQVSGCPYPDSYQLPTSQTNQTNVIDMVTGLRHGRSRVQIPAGARDVSLLQKRPDQRWGPPSLLHNACRRFVLREKLPRHELTAYRHPVPRLRMGGGITLRLICPSWGGQEDFYFYLITENTSQTSHTCSYLARLFSYVVLCEASVTENSCQTSNACS